MQSNLWTRALASAFAAGAFALTVSSLAHAQEDAPPVLLDEPIVQVNSGVLMRSTLEREKAQLREVLVKERNTPAAQADAEITRRQPEIIVKLIDDLLLLQKGQDIPRLADDVDVEVNREVLRVARGANINTLEALDAALRRDGLSLSDIKDTLRRQYTRQAVLQREVDAPIYYGLSDAELRSYHAANRTRFVSVALSEIFLSLAGRSETDVKSKAADLVARARGGADFGELAAANSERVASGVRIAETTKGQLLDEKGQPRFYLLSEVQPVVSNAIKDLEAGGVSDPTRTDEGYMILRINGRDDSFNENVARGMMTQDRSVKEHDKYVRTLRQEAYIKPAANYSEVIQPMLDKDKS